MAMAKKLNPIHLILSHAVVLSVRGLSALVRILPPASWGMMACALTPIFWLGFSKHRQRTIKNLMDTGRNKNEARSLGLACFRSNLLVFFESLAMQRIISRRGVRVERRVSPRAEKIFRKILEGEIPMVIGVSGHVGVWELLGADTAQMLSPVPVTVSARRVKNPVFNDYLVRLRKGYGMEHIDKEAMMRYTVQKIRQKEPRIYVFLCDQHFRQGEKVPFMKRDACTVTMPATLALKYNCPLFMGRCIRKIPGEYRIDIDLLDLTPYTQMDRKDAVRAVTARINEYIEESIKMVPEQWTWAHRRWRKCCESPPAERGAH